LLYLLPAAVFATVAGGRRRKDTLPVIAYAAGATMFIAIIAGVYLWADRNLLLRSAIMLIDGKNPHSGYGLFSGRHLGDVVQTVLLLFPLVIPTLYLAAGRFREMLTNVRIAAAVFMALGGLALVLIIDPVDSIVLDLPRFAGYLTPGAILLALLINERPRERSINPGSLGITAAAAIVLPLSILPVYLNIHTAEEYVTQYLDRHDAYYRTAAVALRDAYFYRGDMDDANRWDTDLSRKSPDYLNYRSVVEFAQGNRLDVALPSLNKLIIRNPYWAEPRALLGSILMDRGEFTLAKPQLDTALMLEPYNPTNFINMYSLYRNAGQMTQALELVRRAAVMFPHNRTIQTDRMLVNYRAGNRELAETLADSLLAVDSTNAFPYVVKGFMAERAGNIQAAIDYYENFADLAPEEPETPEIRKRANELFMQLKENDQ
jgi:tetratricopeptide (TPR) repeat protein